MLLVVQFGVTAFLAGLIWTIQCVHYPSFRRVGRPDFPIYHREHCERVGRVVMPAMVAELILAILCLRETPRDPWLVSSGGLLAVVWGTTGAIFVPLHRRLAQGYDAGAIQALVRRNWIRTLAWTLRAVLLALALRERGT